MNRYAYVFNDPVNATDPSGFISMSDVVKGFVTAGHIAGAGLMAYGSITSGNAPTTNFMTVGGATGGSSALMLPGLQGQPGSGPTVVPSGPDLRLAQNMGDPSTGTDIPGNAPDTVARPDVTPQLGPRDAAVVALPRALVAIAEAAEAWLVRAGAALRALGPTLSAAELTLTAPIIVPSDSVQPEFRPIKAPGIPTPADGFEAPRNWDGKAVPNPNGPGVGYPDSRGRVWIPTGTGPLAHGGPHWDVQTPNGGYENVYPGGKVRAGKR